MRILLTGGTGFVGSHLARKLCLAGHELLLLKRPNSDCWRITDILPQAEVMDWDFEHPGRVFTSYPGIAAVIHAATCYGHHGESASDVAEGNVFRPLLLLEAAAQSGTKVFINTDTF